ncbi:hypothetical protein [Bacteroides thetaiotaomicron]|uniref:hypothetical protein n=1 Tax=Bacteroides thetaiotaomicron TaxID=818 RepID=UPI0039C2D0E4
MNADGTVTKYWDSSNQVVVGDEEPAARGTLGFNLTWKRFSVYTTFMYEFGGQRYNRTLADKVESVDILNENVDSRVLTKRWKQPGDVSAFKKNTGQHLCRECDGQAYIQICSGLQLGELKLYYIGI